MHGAVSYIKLRDGILLILIVAVALTEEPNLVLVPAPVKVLLFFIFHARNSEILQNLLGGGYNHAIHMFPPVGLTGFAI